MIYKDGPATTEESAATVPQFPEIDGFAILAVTGPLGAPARNGKARP
jgi:hypothetical protein